MTIKRYGTSCTEHPEGIYVLHKDYEALERERDALRAELDLFRLLVSTCDALDAKSFDNSNQPGTIRMTLKHNTHTNPEMQAQILDFVEGYKTRVIAERAKEQA